MEVDVAAQDELKQSSLPCTTIFTDQGVAYGSCWKHPSLWLQYARTYVAYFLMKEVLNGAGKLNEARHFCCAGMPSLTRVYPKPTVNGIDIDSFNTQTQGRMASILIMEDTRKSYNICVLSRVGWIMDAVRLKDCRVLSRKMELVSLIVITILGLCCRWLDGATNMIYLLSGTEFKVSERRIPLLRTCCSMRFIVI